MSLNIILYLKFFNLLTIFIWLLYIYILIIPNTLQISMFVFHIVSERCFYGYWHPCWIWNNIVVSILLKSTYLFRSFLKKNYVNWISGRSTENWLPISFLISEVVQLITQILQNLLSWMRKLCTVHNRKVKFSWSN